MPIQPEGSRWPPAADVWENALQRGRAAPFAVYVHVPFCSVRCGYCDFNTYTTGFGAGADLETYAQSVLTEIEISQGRLGAAAAQISTVFFGGGTPTLLEVSSLKKILDGLKNTFGILPGAEITVEANPETLNAARVQELADMGATRISVGMQSADPGVLSVLDRTHRPHLVPHVVQWARDAGVQVSVDLIYGAPGETLGQWETSLQAALAMAPDHVSAYSLVVEQGTKLAGRISRGELEMPDEDLSAEKYVLADRALASAGYRWYEISNFAKELPGEESAPATQLSNASKHNLAYWKDWNWWGYGPGAHSHWGDLRWWNVKHPRAYAGRVTLEESPAFAWEHLGAQTRELERLMLGIRTAEGIPERAGLVGVESLLTSGLLERAAGHLVPTLRGRLMADFVTRTLAGWED